MGFQGPFNGEHAQSTSLVEVSADGDLTLRNNSTGTVHIILAVQGWFDLPEVDPAKQAQADQGAAPVPAGYERWADTPEATAAKPTQGALENLYTLYDEKLFGARAAGVQSAIFLQSSNAQTLDERIADAQAVVEGLTNLPIEEVLPEPQLEPANTNGASSANGVAPATNVRPAAECSPMPDCTGKAYSLPVKHTKQSDCSWCAPASTVMALRSSGASEISAADGKKMSQALLASSAYLNTVNTAGGTDITKIPYTLNKWAKIKATVFWAPSDTKLRDMLRVSLKGYKRAVVFGTTEVKDLTHYNNHPKNRNIRHFITGYGYQDYGRTALFADPVSGAHCYRTRVRQKSSLTASQMAGFIRSHGVVARGES